MVLRQVVHELLDCYAELRRHLTHTLRNAGDAADIAQSTFVQVHAHALAVQHLSPRLRDALVSERPPGPRSGRRALQVGGAGHAGRLRITGSFRIDRPQVLIDSLPKVLPVRVVAAAAGSGAAPRIELR